jgi:hypothetical protein
MSREIDALKSQLRFELEKIDEAVIELSVLVAKELGWKPERKGAEWSSPDGKYLGPLPLFALRIEWAWQVVERMRDEGWHVFFQVYPADYPWGDKPSVSMIYNSRSHIEEIGKSVQSIEGDTIPEAICLAFLRARGVDYDKSYNDDCET